MSRKRFRKASRVTCSSNCKRWSKGGVTSCQSTRRCRKDHNIYKTIRTKEDICKNKVLQHKRRRGRSEKILFAMRSDFWQLSDKVDKNRMVDAEMAAELQELQAGEEVAVMLRKRWIVNKSKTKPVSSWRCQRQACAMKALQRVVWSLIRVLGVLGEGGGAENSGAAKDERNRPSSNSHVDFPWKRKLRWETCKGERVEGTMCQKEKEKRTARERSQEPLKSQLKGKEKTSG